MHELGIIAGVEPRASVVVVNVVNVVNLAAVARSAPMCRVRQDCQGAPDEGQRHLVLVRRDLTNQRQRSVGWKTEGGVGRVVVDFRMLMYGCLCVLTRVFTCVDVERIKDCVTFETQPRRR